MEMIKEDKGTQRRGDGKDGISDSERIENHKNYYVITGLMEAGYR